MLSFLELKQRLTPALHELGARAQEIDLYVHTSLLGPSTVAVLADQLGLSASNVYKLIDRLEQIGLTQFSTQKGYHRKLIVEAPTKVIELLQKQHAHIETLTQGIRLNLDELLASHEQGEAPPVMRVLQGEAQFVRAMRLMFDEVKEEVLVIGSLDHFIELASEETHAQLAQERIAKGIQLRALFHRTSLTERLQRGAAKELRTIRFLPKATTVASMQLSDRRAILWQPKAPLAIVIEDVHLVGLWREMFEGLWKQKE